MEIVKVDPYDEAMVAAWHAAYTEGSDADRVAPTTMARHEIAVGLRPDRHAERWEAYAAIESGRVVGALMVRLPLLDNRTLLMFSLAVPPAERRRGIGSALYQKVVELARAEGRTSLLTELHEPYQSTGPVDGRRFAERRGFTQRIEDLHQVLDLPVDPNLLDRLAADAAAHHAGYQTRTWVGPCPDDLVSKYLVLKSRFMTEVPLGELDMEPEHWDEQRLRDDERRRAAQGRTLYTAVAAAPDGDLVGFTVLSTAAHDPGKVFQNDTMVLPEHRGHRLGVALKVANLRQLDPARIQGCTLHTWNAASNRPMLAVNTALGFRPVERMTEWQRDL